MSRITIAVAFGAGYVVGARAGRERYREIKSRATALWQSDTVQQQTTKAQGLAKDQASKAKDAAKERLPSGLGGSSDESATTTSERSDRSGRRSGEVSDGDRELGSVNAPGAGQ